MVKVQTSIWLLLCGLLTSCGGGGGGDGNPPAAPPASATPVTPALSASVRGINSPTISLAVPTLYQLNLDIEVTNTGNVTAFGARAVVSAKCVHACLIDGTEFFFQADTLPSILPGQAITHTFSPPPRGPVTAGGTYDVTITIVDSSGNAIGSTDFGITVP